MQGLSQTRKNIKENVNKKTIKKIMKNITKFFAIALVILGFSANSFGQQGVDATATSSGTIVSPIAISKTDDMNFGNVAVNANAGTVVLTPAGTRPTVTGGVSLPANTGTVAAASFTVTGATGYTYAISLPSTHTVSFGANNMTVNAFSSTPTVAAGGVLTAGSETLLVGATLNVSGSQAAGTYTSAVLSPFTVTVNYN